MVVLVRGQFWAKSWVVLDECRDGFGAIYGGEKWVQGVKQLGVNEFKSL